MAAAPSGGTALRSLDALPCLSKLFFLTAGPRITQLLMDAGAKHDRLFTMHLGPRRALVATHPETAREILKRPGDFAKSSGFNQGGILDKISGRGHNGETMELFGMNGAEWQALRAKLDPAFTPNALKVMVPLFSAQAGKVRDRWAKSGGRPIDAKADMSNFALDVLGSTVLGRNFNAISGEASKLLDAYTNIMQQMMNPTYMIFPWLEKLPLARNRNLMRDQDLMIAELQSAVDSRLAERAQREAAGLPEEEARDMMDLVLGAGVRPTSGLPTEHVLPNLWLFFVAGHDTTGISLAWLMHFLSLYPDVQRRAREEALSVLQGAETPTAEHLDQVPYISAVINEGLRLRPPVFNLLTRIAVKDTHIDDVAVPKGTMISIHIGQVNRHPEVWDRPEEFDPERFLQKKAPRVFHFLPFSAGPRRCVGDKFSLLEQKALLLTVLSRFEVLPVEGAEGAAWNDHEYGNDIVPLLVTHPKDMHIRLREL